VRRDAALPYPQRMLRSRRSIALALALVAVLAAVSAALIIDGSGRGRPAPASSAGTRAGASSGFEGAALPADVIAPDFTLSDPDGRAVSLSQERGGVSVIAFLSSRCGAVCVLIAQQIRGALDELRKRVTVLIVSVDTAADTRARVKRFLADVSLSGRALFLSGPLARLRAVWRAYRIAPPALAGRAAFERSVTVALVDGRGRERVLFGLEQLTPEALAHDIRRLW
jgi:protein SCO1/2